MPDSLIAERRPAHVLLAEDSTVQAKKLGRLLESNGLRVTLAPNGREALERAAEDPPEIIVSDVLMPDMDGYELCLGVKTDPLLKDTPVLLLTALAEPTDIIRGLQAGADNFLTKPYDDEHLLSRIDYLLANHKPSREREDALEVSFRGERYAITAQRQQVLDLLMSTFDAVLQKNEELRTAQRSLERLNQALAERVEHRTAALHAESVERRRLEGRNEWLAELVNASGDAIVGLTADGLITSWNRGAELIYGHPAEAVLGCSFASLVVPPADQQALCERLARVARGLSVGHHEAEQLARDGRYVWVSLALWPLPEQSGQPGGICLIARDINAQKQAELARELAEAERDALVDQLRQENADLAALTELTAGAVSSLELDTVLADLLSRVATLMGADTAVIFLSDGDQQLVFAGAAGRFADEFAQHARAAGPLLAEQLVSGSTCSWQELLSGAPLPQAPSGACPCRAALTQMLYHDGQRLGAITVAWMTERLVREPEVHLLSVVAQRCTLAIVNARLYERVKVAAEAARASEERYRTLFDGVTDAIFILDPTGEVLEANDAACRMAQRGYDELVHSRLDRLHADWGESLLRADLDHMRRNSRTVFDSEIGQADGAAVPVEVHSRLFGYGGGVAVLACARDISQRRRAEAAQRRLAAAAEAAAEGLLIADADGQICFVNATLEAMHGRRHGELLGQPAHALLDSHDDVYATIAATVRAGRPWRGQLAHQRPNGELFTARASAAPVFDAAGEVAEIVCTETDITAELSVLAQVERAARLQAIGQLAGGVAHDFNNVLFAVMLTCEGLEERLADNEPACAELAEVRRTAQRGANLARRLLAFSRGAEAEPVPLNINSEVRAVGELLRRVIGEEIVLETRLAAKLPPVVADRGQLEQVLLNLAVNARDAMPRGGVLTIRTERLAAADAPAAGLAPRDWVALTVADTGEGMTPEVLARVCEPYFTTKPVGQGSGLGLATVYGIVQQSDGELRVESEPGVGSSFKVWLPAAQEAPPPAAQAVGAAPRSGRGETVLVVEDEDAIRRLVCRHLVKAGYQVLQAADGVAALDALAAAQRPIDLLVTDAVMPRMGGIELIQHLVRTDPGLKAVMVSGYSATDPSEAGLGEHQFRFLAKPLESAQLLATVRELLDS